MAGEKRATDAQIKLIRDAFLESYVRRMPVASPDPDTSIFAALEACAAVLANLLTPQAEAALLKFLEEDRVKPIRPTPDPDAYKPLEPRKDRLGDEHEARKAARAEDAGDPWPCLERARADEL